ncbi:GNAT family N-acetyltransferase [Clostridioides difficile]
MGDLYVKQDNQMYWIGCTICPKYARQGYSQEAIKGLLHWLKTEQNCIQVLASVLPDNLASNNLLKKIGFKFSYFDSVNSENIYSMDLI